MQEDRLFSVIITAYNIEEYIVTAINSVLGQTYSAFEIIVVDDGSSDATVVRAQTVLCEQNNVQVITQENKGPGGARNTGILAATGDYIVFLDGDDWLLETALNLFKQQVESMPDAVFSNKGWFYDKDKSYTSDLVFTKSTQGSVSAGRELLRRYAVPAKAFKRDFLLSNKILFPEGMAWEDYPFSYKVLAKANSINVITDETYIARKRYSENKSLTQKKRLGEFFLNSRFQQIDMDINIVNNSKLPVIFKGLNINNMEFETRLMADIMYLVDEPDKQVSIRSMLMIKDYISDKKLLIFDNVSEPVKYIYQAILDENMLEIIKGIKQL